MSARVLTYVKAIPGVPKRHVERIPEGPTIAGVYPTNCLGEEQVRAYRPAR